MREDNRVVWLRLLIGMAAFAALAVAPAHAQYLWDANGASPGAGNPADGNWSTAEAFWTTSEVGDVATVVWTNGSDANFSAGSDTASGAVNVMGSVTVGKLTFDEGAYTFGGTGSLTVNTSIKVADGLGEQTFGPSMGFNLKSAAWISMTVGTGSAMTIDGNVNGGGGATIQKYGAGTLTLGNVNYSGQTILNAGTLVGTGGSVTSTADRSVTIANTADAKAVILASDSNKPFGTARWVLYKGFTVQSNDATARELANDLLIVGNSVLACTGAGDLTFSGNWTASSWNTPTLVVDASRTVTLTGTTTTANAALYKDGDGTLVLAGTGTLGGGVQLSRGTLVVTGRYATTGTYSLSVPTNDYNKVLVLGHDGNDPFGGTVKWGVGDDLEIRSTDSTARQIGELYNVITGNGVSLHVSGTGDLDFQGGMYLLRTYVNLTVDEGVTATVSGKISMLSGYAGSVRKQGLGTLVLSAQDNSNLSTSLYAGMLVAACDNASAGSLAVPDLGDDMNADARTLVLASESPTPFGTGTWDIRSGLTIEALDANTRTLGNNVSINSTYTDASIVRLSGPGDLVFDGNWDLQYDSRTFDVQGVTATFNRKLNMTGGDFTKTGDGTLAIAATYNNRLGGVLDINGGTLQADGNVYAPYNCNVNSGGTLSGNGKVYTSTTYDVIVDANGTIAPGDSIGTLKIGGDLHLLEDSQLVWELGAPGTGDLLVMTTNAHSQGGAVRVDGNSYINFLDAGGLGVGIYTLIEYLGLANFANLHIGSAPSGFVYELSNNTGSKTIELSVTSGVLVNEWAGPSGDWSTGWTASAPNGAGQDANFAANVTGDIAVNMDVAATVGAINVTVPHVVTISGASTLTLDGDGAAALISLAAGAGLEIASPVSFVTDVDVTGNGTFTLSGAQSHSAVTMNVLGGTTVLASDAGANLSVNVEANLVVTTDQNLAALTVSGAGQVDVTTRQVTLHYGDNASPISNVASYVAAGTIYSSDGDVLKGVGYADNTDANTVTLRYTWNGDATLDGSVTGADLAALATNWNKASGALWAEGDFNHDGAVTGADLAALATNWNKSLAPAGSGAVPEPATMALLGLGAVALLRRRRK